MADPSKIPDILALSVSDPVFRADKQAEILQRFSLIADWIRPKLTVNGANFNTWSKSIIHNWSINSVERSLYDSVTATLIMPNGRTVYQAIKKRFSKTSWSSIVHHANLIFNPTDHAIESQLRPLDSSKIVTLSLFFSLPDLQEKITSALDTCLAANPDLTINAEDILDIVQQMWTKNAPAITEDTMHLSRIDSSTLRPRNSQPSFMPNCGPCQIQANLMPKSASPISKQSEEWKRKWLSPRNLCFYCGEAGNWAPECMACLKAANAIFSSSQRKAMVASIGAIPTLENEEALLDSGETHSAVGDICLFTIITKADMNLLVSSSHRFPVDAIGDVTLMTLQGLLFVKDILLCKAIKGIVLSIGKLISQNVSILILHNTLAIWQNNTSFHTF
ncbi:hypothetical protein O181_053739 [Austropuccinia psidii MF-1]|uniref:CCHC-type domain-containing protein n=1 Tax=Austropuccinia psidii MF-1 TaxID=1389203 RepID=A0A9Q3E387_9BASI|nr:hypothetical protein [Austropuccinia psidii MF-1]